MNRVTYLNLLKIPRCLCLSTLTLNWRQSSTASKAGLLQIAYISIWARQKINGFQAAKDKDHIFSSTPAVGDIEQVICCKLLKVIFFSLILKWTRMYITSSPSVLIVCIRLNFCGIRVCLVNSYQLSHRPYSIIVSRVVYALPAWGGFLSAELTNKINALFRYLKRFGYTTCNIT